MQDLTTKDCLGPIYERGKKALELEARTTRGMMARENGKCYIGHPTVEILRSDQAVISADIGCKKNNTIA